MSSPDNLVLDLMEITGVTKGEALDLLAKVNYNLSMAINNYLESSEITSDQSNSENVEIRAPIAPKRRQLLLANEDNFRQRKKRSDIIFCPFRSFAREAEIHENKIAGKDDSGQKHSPPLILEDLFRPPIDIQYGGNFRAAKEFAKIENRWLLINLQDNKEFKSLVLNRDIWTDFEIRQTIKSYFIFSQVSVNTPDGERMKSFYNISSIPYVCIVDPRTGEEKASFTDIEVNQFRHCLLNYLLMHSYYPVVQDDTSTSHTNPCAGPSNIKSDKVEKSSNICELSEEKQLEMALLKSLEEVSDANLNNDSNDDSIDDFEKYLGDNNDAKTKLQLRLPDGTKIQLEWPLSTKIKAIDSFIKTKYPNLTENSYKIITLFPKQNILDLNMNSTLLQTKLHPSAVLYLHLDE